MTKRIVEDLVDELMVAIMMTKRKRMRLEVTVNTKWETILIVSMIKTIESREEEAKGKDLEEEAFVGNIFIVEKGIKHLNVSNTKEGLVKE